jgi:hypothetical protein
MQHGGSPDAYELMLMLMAEALLLEYCPLGRGS